MLTSRLKEQLLIVLFKGLFTKLTLPFYLLTKTLKLELTALLLTLCIWPQPVHLIFVKKKRLFLSGIALILMELQLLVLL